MSKSNFIKFEEVWLSSRQKEVKHKLNVTVVKHENYDIFKRRFLVCDPYVLIEGMLKQKFRKVNWKAFRKSLKK